MLLLWILAYSALGVAAGLATNRVNAWLDARAPALYERRPVAAALKLLLLAAVLAGAQAASARFAADWQATTPGLFFVSLFFGLQTSLMEDLVV